MKLGLKLQAPRVAWLSALALLLYLLLSMSRDLGFYDTGELALVAAQGGLGHPTGQPLHTLLGWLLSQLMPPLLALNLLSALPTALMLLPLASLAERMSPKRFHITLAPLIALLLLHFAFWSSGSRIEVYALGNLLVLWGIARVAGVLHDEQSALPAGLAFGLSAAVNPVVALGAALALVPILLLSLWRSSLSAKRLAGIILGGLLGLLPYLYVFWVGQRQGQGIFLWGAPQDLASAQRFFSNADFAGKQASGMAILEHLQIWLRWAIERGLAPLLFLGLLSQLRRGPLGRFFGLLLLLPALLFICLNGAFYPDNPDYLGYLGAPLALLLVSALGGLTQLSQRGRLQEILASLLLLSLLSSALLAEPSLWNRRRHRDHSARQLLTAVMESAPQGAVLLMESDHWVFPAFYLQSVERLRPDLVLLSVGLSGSSWYWRWLYEQHPELKPIQIRAPGGRGARIQRFLKVQERPTLFESLPYAIHFGPPACMGRWLLGDARACQELSKEPDSSAELIRTLLAEVGEGASPADRVLARVAYERGEALWRLGRPTQALETLRAGVPEALLPPKPGDVSFAIALRGPAQRWRERTIIGHFSQNLFLASKLLWAARQKEAAEQHMRAAALAGLLEALDAEQ